MQPWTLVYIFVALVAAFLVRAISQGKRKFNNPKMFYYASLVAMIFWLLFNFLAVNAGSEEQAILFYITMLASIAVMVAFIYLNVRSFRGKIKPLDVGIGLIPLFFLMLFSYTITVQESIYGWGLGYSFFERVLVGLVSGLVIYTIYLLITTRRDITNKESRWRLKIYTMSIALSLFAAILLSFISQYAGIPSLSSIGAGLFLSLGYFAFKK